MWKLTENKIIEFLCVYVIVVCDWAQVLIAAKWFHEFNCVCGIDWVTECVCVNVCVSVSVYICFVADSPAKKKKERKKHTQ